MARNSLTDYPMFFVMTPARVATAASYESIAAFARPSDEIMARLPKKFRDMPWIDEDGIPTMLMAKSGLRWTDCLRKNWPSESWFVVSERVAESIVNNNLKGAEFTPLHIDASQSKRLKPPPCNYYAMYAQGQPLRYHYRVFEEFGEGFQTHYVLRFETRNRADYENVSFKKCVIKYPVLSEWDGSDFCKLVHEDCTHFMHCSRRVVEVARKDNWSNFTFMPIDYMEIFGACDFRERGWPPETWYPANQPKFPSCVP